MITYRAYSSKKGRRAHGRMCGCHEHHGERRRTNVVSSSEERTREPKTKHASCVFSLFLLAAPIFHLEPHAAARTTTARHDAWRSAAAPCFGVFDMKSSERNGKLKTAIKRCAYMCIPWTYHGHMAVVHIDYICACVYKGGRGGRRAPLPTDTRTYKRVVGRRGVWSRF